MHHQDEVVEAHEAGARSQRLFAKVPEWLLFDVDGKSTFSPREIQAYAVIARHGENAFPGQARLAKLMGCTTDTVRAAVGGLESRGAVRVTRSEPATKGKARTSNRYELAFEAPFVFGGSRSDSPTPSGTDSTRGSRVDSPTGSRVGSPLTKALEREKENENVDAHALMLIDEILSPLDRTLDGLKPNAEQRTAIIEVAERNPEALTLTVRNAVVTAKRNPRGLFLFLIVQTYADGCRTPELAGGVTAQELWDRAMTLKQEERAEDGPPSRGGAVTNIQRARVEQEHSKLLDKKRAWLENGGYGHPDQDQYLADLEPDERQQLITQYEIDHAELAEFESISEDVISHDPEIVATLRRCASGDYIGDRDESIAA